MPIFSLTIKLGNAAMQTPADVAQALRSLADRLESGDPSARIRDLNGNTVGAYAADWPDVDESEEC